MTISTLYMHSFGTGSILAEELNTNLALKFSFILMGFGHGWYVVWQLFLSKFKFLRELIGDTGSQQGDNEPSETEAEQETPPSPHRGRQKSARQRRAPTEDTT
ncbi:PREDICTED: small integral membrane protein 13 [Chlamydotis macqueenii]|uniref:small integral membrane protein 13 n=1 Tax=Chlamydotis macqueenii TaxID=187382 RepID=UPI0005298743|nr:PREDICTED: small integral membrane protein 13 [Chlamydotis macqueenii]